MRVGADVASTRAVASSIDMFGDRYARRIFSEGELERAGDGAEYRASRLATRFAAKEATIKVLRPAGGIDWRQIEVTEDDAGSCAIDLHGAARALADEAGVASLALAMSRQGDLALAVVVALLATKVS